MNITIPGIRIDRRPTELTVQSETPMQVLSSAVVNGGYTQSTAIINLHVKKGYNGNDPVADFINLAKERGYPTPFVGLMTAAYVIESSIAQVHRGEITVAGITTAGLSNACAAGLSQPAALRPGTINTILIVDANLTPAAMVNAIITATEAKTAVIHGFGFLTSEGYPVTGTSTDSVAIACTGTGDALQYAGSATTVGYLIAQAVRETLTDQLERREEFRQRYEPDAKPVRINP